MGEFSEADWKTLLARIARGKCTAIVGPGMCSPQPPAGAPDTWKYEYPLNPERSQQWAKEVDYPFAEPGEFDRVAQFVAIDRDPKQSKEFIQELFTDAKPPDLSCENEPHRILAALPIPIYLTTNYDDFLSQALTRARREVVLRLCPWNKHLVRLGEEIYEQKSPEPNAANPLVYHFLGRFDYPKSLVVAEDDHYEFLMNVARREEEILNHWVQRALGDNVILLVGYGLHDRDFLILLRLLGHFLRDNESTPIAVQLDPGVAPGADRTKAAKYLEKYFDNFKTRIYRGDCKQFTAELWKRWKEREQAAPAP